MRALRVNGSHSAAAVVLFGLFVAFTPGLQWVSYRSIQMEPDLKENLFQTRRFKSIMLG